jgi:hypothetical protein
MDTVVTSTAALSDVISGGEGLATAIASGEFWTIFLAVIGLATAVLQYAPVKGAIRGTKVDWISPLVMILATIGGSIGGAGAAGACPHPCAPAAHAPVREQPLPFGDAD